MFGLFNKRTRNIRNLWRIGRSYKLPQPSFQSLAICAVFTLDRTGPWNVLRTLPPSSIINVCFRFIEMLLSFGPPRAWWTSVTRKRMSFSTICCCSRCFRRRKATSRHKASFSRFIIMSCESNCSCFPCNMEKRKSQSNHRKTWICKPIKSACGHSYLEHEI